MTGKPLRPLSQAHAHLNACKKIRLQIGEFGPPEPTLKMCHNCYAEDPN